MSDRYSIEFTDDAKASLSRLSRTVARRILKKLNWLADNASVYKHIALSGRWSGHYKLRVGDYRVIYKIDGTTLVIIVVEIGHRREVYDR